MKKKIEIEEELNVKKGKIGDLERLISDLKKQLEEEMRKQKLSAEALLEELVPLPLPRKGKPIGKYANSRRRRRGRRSGRKRRRGCARV
jgi:hypothetical protein